MKLLLAGPSALVREWLDACSGLHECTVLRTSARESIPRGARCAESPLEARDTELAIDLHLRRSARRRSILRSLDAALGPSVPILANTCAVSATEVASWLEHPGRVYGIAALPTLLAGSVVEAAAPHGQPVEFPDTVKNLFTSIDRSLQMVRDEAGLVFPRILCLIINEAVLVLQQGIAEPEAIDTAMRLGVNYPDGPLSWGKRIGWKNVHTVLLALQRELGDDRYRPAPLLKKLALTT